MAKLMKANLVWRRDMLDFVSSQGQFSFFVFISLSFNLSINRSQINVCSGKIKRLTKRDEEWQPIILSSF